MLLRSIRSRLVGLVVASVVPFAALISIGLWNQWHRDHKAALERALNEARLIASQVDDHVDNLKNPLSGVSVAVSWDPKDTESNDRLLRRVKSGLPPYLANLMVFSLEGTNIGTSSDSGRFFAGDRDYMQKVLAEHPHAMSVPMRSRASSTWV